MAHGARAAGHLNVTNTMTSILWLSMKKDIRLFVAFCTAWHTLTKRRAPLKNFPRKKVTMEILSHVPETHRCNKYILVANDFLEILHNPNKAAIPMADTLVNEIFLNYSTPVYLHKHTVSFQTSKPSEKCWQKALKQTEYPSSQWPIMQSLKRAPDSTFFSSCWAIGWQYPRMSILVCYLPNVT